MTTRDELLALHDEQIRGTIADRMPSTWTSTWDGPLLRITAPRRGFAFARGLDDLTVGELDELIGRTRDFFAQRGAAVEWKTYDHDRGDLTERLRLAGFVPEEVETVVVGRAADLVKAGDPPDGVTIRATADAADFRRIAAMESEVWGADWGWLADDLGDRVATAPDNIVVLVAEAGGRVVSAAWLVVVAGTEFGALWGGSTLAEWRRRGIYRALVAARARIAVDRGLRYLMVDASADSRPVLERLGLIPICTTTPWVWSPPAG